MGNNRCKTQPFFMSTCRGFFRLLWTARHRAALKSFQLLPLNCSKIEMKITIQSAAAWFTVQCLLGLSVV